MMTKEEIFLLAEKADLYLASDDSVINFAKLIAEKERKEWAREFAGMGEWTAVHMLEERGQE